MKAMVNFSSHSIDITFGGISKTAVVRAIRACVGAEDDAPVLRMGDKGRWPGNDSELLNDPFGLSVDEVSSRHRFLLGIIAARLPRRAGNAILF